MHKMCHNIIKLQQTGSKDLKTENGFLKNIEINILMFLQGLERDIRNFKDIEAQSEV